MNQSVCELEQFVLGKLHLDFRPPPAREMRVTQVRCNFDYGVGTHKTDANRYRLTLRFDCHEAADDKTEVGNAVKAEISGFFRFPEGTEKKQMEALIRVNGVSILYGILRGIVANSTGVFPNGKFLLPTIMPQDIVKQVEAEKAAASKKNKPTKHTAKK